MPSAMLASGLRKSWSPRRNHNHTPAIITIQNRGAPVRCAALGSRASKICLERCGWNGLTAAEPRTIRGWLDLLDRESIGSL